MLTEEPITTNNLYPVFLKLEKLSLLLVGGGNVGLHKLQSILGNSPEARVTVVAPSILPAIHQLAVEHPFCHLEEREFRTSDLEQKDLIILATDNPLLHQEIRLQASEKAVLVNVADTPDLCDFHLGSIVQKGYRLMGNHQPQPKG